MVFLTESWFWRGTQSAIFYYASCTPWVEYKHGKKRKRQAAKARKERNEDTIYMQPGVVRQPAPFQTNEEWAQEIVEGPGPPKGWKRDQIWHKYQNHVKLGDLRSRARAETGTSSRSDWTVAESSTAIETQQASAHQDDGSVQHNRGDGAKGTPSEVQRPRMPIQPHAGTYDRDLSPGMSSTVVGSRQSVSPEHLQDLQPTSSHGTETTGSKRLSFDSGVSAESSHVGPRPSMEKRLSTAMDGFRDAMRAALHPDKWNWIRYDRDDEILPDLNGKMKSMWENMKVNVSVLSDEAAAKLKQIEPKEPVPESAASKWQRGTHPAVNDLHPPIVSQLPYSREEAKWMLMPPPSADVMMGRRRPDPFSDTKRRPMCVIGRAKLKVELTNDTESHPVSPDETDSSEDEDWSPGWTNVQRPQRAYLRRQRQQPVS